VTANRSAKVLGYAVLSGMGLLGSLVLGTPVPAAMAVPFLVLLIVGMAVTGEPRFELSARLERERALEGDVVGLQLDFSASSDVGWVQVLPALPADLSVNNPVGALGIHLRPGDQRRLTVELACHRWGVYRVGRLVVRVHDAFRLFTFESVLEPDLRFRVYPRPEALSRLVPPAETQVFSGNEVSRRKGEGIEFADARPFLPGDQVRRVNWPLSTRLGELHVNERLQERNADVVVFLDTFSELRLGHDGTLEMAVRAASVLAEHYLRRRDRLGLVSFGGTLRWIRPSMGVAQAYQVAEALIDTRVAESYAWKGIEVVPPRMLPPKALVVALTPLLDERTIHALFDLRGRGYDLTVLEVAPESFAGPSREQAGELGYRLWRLRRDVLRNRYRQLGVAVVRWRPGQPLERALEEVREFRRFARRALA
jgi:uncharacterized protein (DUF58 family)